MGAPPESLDVWLERIMSTELFPFAADGDERMRVYAPDIARAGAIQWARWIEHFDGVEGRYLAEIRRVFGAREHRVVEVTNGRVVKSGAVFLQGEPRRIMYALDHRAKNPVRAGWVADTSEATLTLGSEVPWSEQRLFAALGALDIPETSYYPRVWRFDPAHAPVVEQRLRGLGVELVQPSGRGN